MIFIFVVFIDVSWLFFLVADTLDTTKTASKTAVMQFLGDFFPATDYCFCCVWWNMLNFTIKNVSFFNLADALQTPETADKTAVMQFFSAFYLFF